jgi:hypothetical protein
MLDCPTRVIHIGGEAETHHQMATGYQPLLSGLLVAGMVACTSPTLLVKAIPEAGQTVIYERGQVQLHAGAGPMMSVGLPAHKDDKVLIYVQVRNETDQALLFGPSNISGELVSSDGKRQVCGVQRFEELTSRDDYAWAWDGASSAVGIGGALIPGGAVAQNLLRVGINEGKRQNTGPQEFTLESLKDQYLRLHTLAPGNDYQGLLKVHLPRRPLAGDVLVATIDLADWRESFSFGFEP